MSVPHHVFYISPQADAMVMLEDHAKDFPDVDVTCIVGEGEQHKYVTLFTSLLADLRPNKLGKVIQGFGSEEKFELEGDEEVAPDSRETIIQNIRNLPKADLVVSVKPIREFVDPEANIRHPGADLIIYASRNVETIKPPVEWINEFMATFKSVEWVTSYEAIGEENTALYPLPPTDGTTEAPVKAKIRKGIKLTNTNRLVQCSQKIAELAKKQELDAKEQQKLKNNQKIVLSIAPNPFQQFTLANPIMFGLTERPAKRIRITGYAPQGFIQHVEDPESNVRAYGGTDEDKKARRQACLKKLFTEN